MALTYLGLVNAALRRLNEVELTSATFATATGFHGAVKDYVNEAIYDINIAELEWPFNRAEVNTPIAENEYSFDLSPNAAVDWETVYSLDTNTNQLYWMMPMDYDEWRQRYFEIQPPFKCTGQPSRIVKVPNANSTAYFWPPADKDDYVIFREECALPTGLVDFDDTTLIPDAFEQVIIDKVMQYAYEFRSNTESATRMDARYKLGLSTMRTFLLNRYEAVRDTRVNLMLRSRT